MSSPIANTERRRPENQYINRPEAPAAAPPQTAEKAKEASPISPYIAANPPTDSMTDAKQAPGSLALPTWTRLSENLTQSQFEAGKKPAAAPADGTDPLGALQARLDGLAGKDKPASAPSVQEQKLGEAVSKALASGNSKDLAFVKEMAKELRNSDNKTVSDLGRAAERVCEGLESFHKPGAGEMDRLKGLMKICSAGPLAARAAINELETRGTLDKTTANELKTYLATPGGHLFSAFSEAGQAMDALSDGQIAKGLQHLSALGAEGFQAAKPFLKAAGLGEDKLKAMESLANASKDGIAKINKGLQHWEKGNYGAAFQEFGGAGRDVLTGLAPLLGESAQGLAKVLGPLAKATGDIASAAPDLGIMMDQKQPFSERLNAAQRAISQLGVAAVRGLATSAFGDKIGNGVADAIDYARKKVIGFDQETGKISAEAQQMIDKAWNKEIRNGEFMARLMGYKTDTTGMSPEELKTNQALSNFPEFWAEPKLSHKMRSEFQKTLYTQGPEAALEKYKNASNSK